MSYFEKKYHGYNIKIESERYFPAVAFYCTMFCVSKGDNSFSLSCRLNGFTVLNGLVKVEDVKKILRQEGLKKIYELIDSQKFENQKTYIGELRFNGEFWQCIIVSSARTPSK